LINKDLKLTLVTVCRNSQYSIAKTMDSIERQIDKNFVHIIIEGKSTDLTLEIINKYSSTNRFIYSDKDSGIYDAMNKGISFCTTEYLTFLNSDDYIDENFVKNINQYIKYGYDYIYSSVYAVRLNEKPKLFIPPEIKSNFNFQYMPFPHPGLVVKKSIFTDIGNFNLNYKYAADLEWILRLVSKKKYSSFRNTTPNIYYTIGGAGNSYKSFSESIKIYKSYNSSYLFLIKKIITGYLRLYVSKFKDEFKK